ncbi:MAG: DNA-directed RNA polymerase subunit omega [Calditerricola sp.]|nr:DNA-directed RNA polymerase subunit omega [Bacillota bacterium]MCG0314287.1 DNA-directed RNA polymerase subunit omega [Calditerricola sp.]
MLYPSIDKLMERINSKYTLVTVAAKRARQLKEREKPLVEEPYSAKPVGVALEEIEAGRVTVADDTNGA